MYIFIVNPIAGNGKASRYFSIIKKSKLYKEINSKYYLTKYKGHAEEIVRTLKDASIKDIKTIIVIGGDGTLHEVMNGLEHRPIPISIIPGGSGNDFARGCSISGKPLEILERIIYNQKNTSYWVGNYRADNELKRFFVNNIGFGFDAQIAQVANNSSYKKLFNFLRIGKFSYVIALIQSLFKFKPIDIEIEINGSKRKVTNCWMVTISNHPYYGGGMKVIPDATIQPSKFPVMLIHSISKWKILALFTTVFSGNHIKYKEVEILEARKLHIISDRKIVYQVDGETSTCTTCTVTKQSNSMQINGTSSESINKAPKLFHEKV